MENAIKELAVYFTGPAVAAHSMGLSMGGANALVANLFFEARSKLGISGYATPQEAEAALLRAFERATA